jgi:hypothetical protein
MRDTGGMPSHAYMANMGGCGDMHTCHTWGACQQSSPPSSGARRLAPTPRVSCVPHFLASRSGGWSSCSHSFRARSAWPAPPAAVCTVSRLWQVDARALLSPVASRALCHASCLALRGKKQLSQLFPQLRKSLSARGCLLPFRLQMIYERTYGRRREGGGADTRSGHDSNDSLHPPQHPSRRSLSTVGRDGTEFDKGWQRFVAR